MDERDERPNWNRPNRILLVDNDELVLEAIAARLEGEGYEVHAVVNAMQALAIFRRHDIDFVIADINMPGLDGIGLSEDLRAFSEVPILLITAYPEDYAGGIGHLPDIEILAKPFSWPDLESRMSAAMV